MLLAQALFGKPDIILLDEPTNHLDIQAIALAGGFSDGLRRARSLWSRHDRHFLNTVCTHIVDVDYSQIKMYVGNYDFWYESSQMVQRMIKDQNKKNEEKIKELQAVHPALLRQQVQIQAGHLPPKAAGQADGGGNARLLPPVSLRGLYRWIGRRARRSWQVEGISKTHGRRARCCDNVSFRVNKGDKIAFVGENEIAKTTLFKIVMGEMEPDEGTLQVGRDHHHQSISRWTTPPSSTTVT